MKKFDEFINENKEFRYIDYIDIKDYITNALNIELKKMTVGDEGLTVTTTTSKEYIEGIGSQSDFELENGSFTHVIVGIRLFYGNSNFINKFNSMNDLGKHLIKIEDKIKSIFKVEKIVSNETYFVYLIPITDDIRNGVKSTNGVDKFNL